LSIAWNNFQPDGVSMSEESTATPKSWGPAQPYVGAYRGEPEYADSERLIRGALEAIGLRGDSPLSGFIQPGDRVLLKPNLIREGHTTRPSEWEQVITHGAVIDAIARLAARALQGHGSIVIADGPQTDSDFDAICGRTNLWGIQNHLRNVGVDCEVLDLRRDRWFQKGDVIFKRIELPGDPAGYTTVDLGSASEFCSYTLSGNFYGADYDSAETARFHSDGRHAYVLCRTVMDADVVINIPKLKTHKKTGVTLSLKNLVGINGYRNCLPHFTQGTPDDLGDEFPSKSFGHKLQSHGISLFKKMLVASGRTGGTVARLVKQLGRKTFGDTNRVTRSGNWYGNDTIWRMVLDLNKALFYFDGSAAHRQKPIRYLTILDGIIAGEGNGPVMPDPFPAGLIIAGFDPVAVDSVAATLMGFDDAKIPLLAGAWRISSYPLATCSRDAVKCISNVSEWNGGLAELAEAPSLGMKTHFGWLGSIERRSRAETVGAY
jgi:uncharacterized protein (DUF362 family)